MQSPIFDLSDLTKHVNQDQQPRPLVLATGVFDLLHQEHKRFLEAAKTAGAFLIVGLETDKRVTAMKGPDRPINTLEIRLANLSQLSIADAVFALPEDFSKPEHHRQLLEQIRPDILAVSSHSAHQDKKQQLMESIGGKVQVVHEHNPAVSTTQIISTQRSDLRQ